MVIVDVWTADFSFISSYDGHQFILFCLISFRAENRIEFRDAEDLNTVVLDHSVAPHNPFELCTSSKTTLWYESYSHLKHSELYQLKHESSLCPTSDAIHVSFRPGEIMYDMCHIEAGDKSLLVTANGMGGLTAYNTNTKKLVWSKEGKLRETEDIIDIRGITTDRLGHLFACDENSQCLHVFCVDGKYIKTLLRGEELGLGQLTHIRWSEGLLGLIVAHHEEKTEWISVIKIEPKGEI